MATFSGKAFLATFPGIATFLVVTGPTSLFTNAFGVSGIVWTLCWCDAVVRDLLVQYACIFPQEIARSTTFQLFRANFGGLWLRVTCVARVWPFGLVLGVRASNMLVSGYG